MRVLRIIILVADDAGTANSNKAIADRGTRTSLMIILMLLTI